MDLQLVLVLLLGLGAVASLLRRCAGLRRGKAPGGCSLCDACHADEPGESGSLETLLERPRRPRA